QTPAQFPPAPALPREESEGGHPRAAEVEGGPRPGRTPRPPRAHGQGFLEKGPPDPPGGRLGSPAAGRGGAAARAPGWGCCPPPLVSHVISPVEKMPFTLRSKSSALVAASRAVSYVMSSSRYSPSSDWSNVCMPY